MDNGKKRASPEQLEVLLLALEKRPSMQNVRSSGTGATKNLQYWHELAGRLNTMGVCKTATKWQQAWRDWKSNTKKKASKLLEDKSKPSDGRTAQQPLTDMEVRVLNLVGADLSDVKPPEIDISNIAELDPLSSDEDCSSDDAPLVFKPNMVTVYNLGDAEDTGEVPVKTEETVGKRRSKHKSGKIKKHRIEFRPCFSSERMHKTTSEIAHRLATLEESRRQAESRTNTLLERLCLAMEGNTEIMAKCLTAMENQAQTLQGVKAALEARFLYNPAT